MLSISRLVSALKGRHHSQLADIQSASVRESSSIPLSHVCETDTSHRGTTEGNYRGLGHRRDELLGSDILNRTAL